MSPSTQACRKVDVVVEARDELRLLVADDGAGLPERIEPGQGLRNMERRALELGGRAEIRPGEGDGTVVEWHVPLG